MSSGSVDLGTTFSTGSGSVTTISVATANGFAGSVATPSTTPVITLRTTVTGILSGNGTAISAASTTGSGSVVLATSPTIVTPTILNIMDATPVLAINVETRELFRADGSRTLSWQDSTLVDPFFNSPSVYWSNRLLIDNGGVETAIDWGGRILYDNASISSVNWDGRFLQDSTGSATVVWGDKELRDSTGNQSVYWETRTAVDSSTTTSVDWGNRLLVDIVGNQALEWNDRVLIDDTSNIVAEWNTRNLIQSNGIDSSINWGSLLLYDNSTIRSVDWGNRVLVNSSGDTVFEYETGLLYHPDIGAGRVAVVDAGNAVLKNPNNGDTVFDFGNQQLYDGNGQTNVNARDRTLVDGSGNIQFEWSNTSGPSFPKVITSYNGITTAGQGVPPVVASIDLTNQASSIGTTTLYASTTASMYEVSVYILTTTTSAAGTVLVTIGWTDAIAARTVATSTILLTGNNYLQQSIVLKTAASTNITYATTTAAVTGSPKYELAIVAKKLT